MSDPLDFEKALAELERVVEQLQRPELPLEQAVCLYRRGTELAQKTEQMLTQADLQVQQLTEAVRERFAEYSVNSEDDPQEI